jgi:hypothetical protein
MTRLCQNSGVAADRHGGRARHVSHPATLGVLAVLLCSILAVGCMNIRMSVGARPNPDLLETRLRMGESTQAEVLRVLGEPFGKGQAMLPIDPRPRAMWSYYYEEGDTQDSRRIFLFVYFDQNRYDGYMWFSSLLQ